MCVRDPSSLQAIALEFLYSVIDCRVGRNRYCPDIGNVYAAASDQYVSGLSKSDVVNLLPEMAGEGKGTVGYESLFATTGPLACSPV